MELDSEKKKLIEQNNKVIDIIRCYPDIERGVLAKKVGVSLPTLSNLINELKNNDILLSKSVKDIEVNKDSLIINPDICMYAGISIGASQIKVSFINFDFSVLSQEKFKELKDEYNIFEDAMYSNEEASAYGYACVRTPNEYEDFVDTIDQIIGNLIVLDHALREENSCIMGIGFAITGAIDNQSKKIVNSYNLECLNGMTISYDTLIYGNRLSYLNENNIDLAFENIARAAVISEKYNLYNKNNINNRHKNKKNIACIYLGSGIGAGLVLNDILYRGTSNFSEFGHIDVCDPDDIKIEIEKEEKVDKACTCGNKNCLEYKVRKNALGMSFESFKSISALDLKKNIGKDPQKDEKLRLLGYYIGKAANTLINILNLDLVIFTGKLTVLMDELWKYLNPIIASNKITYTTTDCSIIVSSYGPLAPAIGAAISSANADSTDISWE